MKASLSVRGCCSLAPQNRSSQGGAVKTDRLGRRERRSACDRKGVGRCGSAHALARASLLVEFRPGRGGGAIGEAAPLLSQQAAIWPPWLLYAETAIALLALPVVRRLSNVAPPVRILRRGGLAPAVLNRACDYMVSRMPENVSLSEVAGIADLSLAHFSFAFKTSMGMAPHAWLRRQRADRAKALLLDSSLTLSAVALSVGFSSQSAFGAAFKRETGWTPAAWRRGRLL
jgi:AraC-like DNA-binding protein